MPPPLSSIIVAAARAVRKHGVVGAWRNARNSKHLRAGFWDGGLLVALLKEDGAVLKGVDSYGNQYWEKMQDQHGRHRWVKYADAVDYDAASVPPEWHGWLHHITDHTHEQLEELKPTRYGLDAWDRVPKYMAKGYALHPQRRNWKHFESWQSVETHGPAQVCNAPAPEKLIPEPQFERVRWEDMMKIVPDPPPPEKVCREVVVKIIPDPPPEKVCWDGTKTVVSDLPPSEKICWDATIKVISNPPPPEKVCWDATIKVISDSPPPEKVCWDATIKVISDSPPPEKVCWDATVKVIPGVEQSSKEPPKKAVKPDDCFGL